VWAKIAEQPVVVNLHGNMTLLTIRSMARLRIAGTGPLKYVVFLIYYFYVYYYYFWNLNVLIFS
jgi:hypothetical protein